MQILLLRQPKRFSRLEKTLLTTLVTNLRRMTSDFRSQVQPVLIFSPGILLRWHRELVRRKSTFRRKAAVRPKISPKLEALML